MSGFQLTKGASSILIDPSNTKAGDINGELVYCTHRHSDHTGGISSFMERNSDAILLTNEQVAKKFKRFSDRRVIAYDGGSFQHGEWEFQFIECKHGLFNDLNLGVIVRNDDDFFGHCGDAVTFEGFSSIQVDTLAIPITSILTVSPVGAISELKKFVQPLPTIVVMHWVFRNPEGFCRKLSMEIPGTRCIVPEKGKLIPLTESSCTIVLFENSRKNEGYVTVECSVQGPLCPARAGGLCYYSVIYARVRDKRRALGDEGTSI